MSDRINQTGVSCIPRARCWQLEARGRAALPARSIYTHTEPRAMCRVWDESLLICTVPLGLCQRLPRGPPVLAKLAFASRTLGRKSHDPGFTGEKFIDR